MANDSHFAILNFILPIFCRLYYCLFL